MRGPETTDRNVLVHQPRKLCTEQSSAAKTQGTRLHGAGGEARGVQRGLCDGEAPSSSQAKYQVSAPRVQIPLTPDAAGGEGK